MIGMLRRWIKRIADEDRVVPAILSNSGPPLIQIFKIDNGYLIHKNRVHAQYRDDAQITFCPTPLDVARQIINSEALQKMGITPEVLNTSGITAGSFVTKI
jgi:hypothetical protein